MRKAREKERKYAIYLEKQREKLADHNIKKGEEEKDKQK